MYLVNIWSVYVQPFYYVDSIFSYKVFHYIFYIVNVHCVNF
jgi:hypothetical protein